MFSEKKVIIFDLDGTLIDSLGIWNKVDLELITQIRHPNAPQPKDIQKNRETILSNSTNATNPYVAYCHFLKQYYQAKLQANEIHLLRYRIAQNYLTYQIKYKPGAAELIRQLKQANFALAIATTTKKSNIDIYANQNQNIINNADLNKYFSLILTREDVQIIKPNPEVYLSILRKMKVSPHQCLAFEDSLVGIKAAKKAGLEVVAVYDKHNDSDWESITQLADYNIKDYSELTYLSK